MLLQPSRYNILLESRHCIYNTSMRKLYHLNDSYWNEYKNLANNTFVDLDDNSFWIHTGLFVNTCIDERAKIEKQRIMLFSNPSQLMITIIPTMRCNFDCRYCYEKPTNNIWTDSDSKTILDYCKKRIDKAKTISVGWFGGEPTLATADIIRLSHEVAYLCWQKGVKFYGGMTTNGYLLTPVLFKLLVHYGITHFHITLDGPDSAHDKLRPLMLGGGPTYNTIVNNLLRISQLAESEHCRFTIRINICRINIDLINPFLEHIKTLFGGHPAFGVQFSLVSDFGGDRISDIYGELMDSRCIENLRKKAAALNLRMHDIEDSYLGVYGAVCYAAQTQHIGYCVGGHFFKCTCYLYESSNSIGGIRPNGEIEIDKEKLNKWIEFPEPNEKCLNCSAYPLCYHNACPRQNANQGEHLCPMVLVPHNMYTNLELLCGYNNLVEELTES